MINSKGISDYSAFVYYNSICADNMVQCALATQNPSEYFPKIFSLCSSTIEKIENGTFKNVSVSDRFRVQYALGRAYHYATIFMHPSNREDYRQLAYNTLSPLLDYDYGKTDGLLTDAGYYCAMTGKCTISDLKKIIKNYKNGIVARNFDDNPHNYTHYLIQVLSTCTLISLYPDYDINVNDLGMSISEEVINKINYVQQPDIDTAHGYYNYFHNNDTSGLDVEPYIIKHLQNE